MKKRILLFTSIAGMIALTMSSYLLGPATQAYDCTGAESASAGAFANPTGCSASGGSCHSSSATASVSTTIELDSAGVPTTRYIGGNTYTVKISGKNNTGTLFPYFGFQLTSIKGSASAATVSNAGTWTPYGLPARTQLTAPNPHGTQLNIIEHSDTIEVINDTFSRSFAWTAPIAGTGTISFWGAVNFVNGSTNITGTPSIAGDDWNTNHVIITEETHPSGVANVSNSMSIDAFPNPTSDNLNLQINNGEAGIYSIQVFDIEGKCVSTEDIHLVASKYVTTINSGSWAPGLYIVVVQKDNNCQIVRVVKSL